MAAVVCDIPQVPQASAFSNGKHQVITNASVLNANGPITIYGAPQSNVPQDTPESSFLHKLLAATLDFFRGNLQDNAKRELPQIETVPDTDVDSDEDYTSSESVRSYDSDTTCVSMTPSYNKAFIPLEALHRGPSSCGTYITHMFPLRLGYPIWLPQPDRNLPVQYRRKGISTGDVGVITPDGGFDFLFNIWASAQDPVHLDGLPDDFDSMPRPKQRTSFQSLFPSGSKVSSLDIESDYDVNTKDISYACKNGDKGAILSLPHGASQEILRNEWDLKEFIAKNAIDWYKHALLCCGRDVDRHSLYVVTGCIKSRTWGIATFDTEAQECHNTLLIGESHNTNDPSYIWKKSGGATTFRSGPSPDPGLISEGGIQSEIENQDLFLRGFKISLSEESWNSIREPVGLMVDDKTGAKPFLPDQSCEPGSGGQSREDGSFSGVQPSTFTDLCCNISISNFPATDTPPHPLNAINDMLLSKIPEARIAITHDNFWCEVFNQDGCGVKRLQESIEDRYVVNYCKETWACTLEPRVNHPAFDESEQVDILSPNLRELALEGAPPFSLFIDVEEETWRHPISCNGSSIPISPSHHSTSTNYIKSHTSNNSLKLRTTGHNAAGTKYQYRCQQLPHGSSSHEEQNITELLEHSPQAVLEAGHLPNGYRLEYPSVQGESRYYILVTPHSSRIISVKNEGVPFPNSTDHIRRKISIHNLKAAASYGDSSWLSCLSQLIQIELDRTLLKPTEYKNAFRLLRDLASEDILPYSLFVDVKEGRKQPMACGGSADVYTGMINEQRVRVKVVRSSSYDQQAYKQFIRECVVWRQLKHPNILPCLGVSESFLGHSPSLVSPWMENGTIIEFLERNPEHDRLRSLREIASGIEYLHGHHPPIVHRDIKGANILVSSDLICCLADFGLSSIRESQRSVDYSHGTLCWTAPERTDPSKAESQVICWMAPERLDPDKFPDSNGCPADIYSFAWTIIEICCGLHPSQGKSLSFIREVLDSARTPPPLYGCTPIDKSIWDIIKEVWHDPNHKAQGSSRKPLPSDISAPISGGMECLYGDPDCEAPGCAGTPLLPDEPAPIDKGIWNIVKECLHRDPSQRLEIGQIIERLLLLSPTISHTCRSSVALKGAQKLQKSMWRWDRLIPSIYK